MNDHDRDILLAAIRVLTSVSPETITRNNRTSARTGVDPHDLAELRDAIERAYPKAIGDARDRRTCEFCGFKPWQKRHQDQCPKRFHVVYIGGRPYRPGQELPA